jgi:hypothetical protein
MFRVDHDVPSPCPAGPGAPGSRPRRARVILDQWSKMGGWFSRCIEFEHNGASSKFYLTLNEHNETNLAALYEQLMKTFHIPLDTNITGFICEHAIGGPICPFRLIAGLRGTIFYLSSHLCRYWVVQRREFIAQVSGKFEGILRQITDRGFDNLHSNQKLNHHSNQKLNHHLNFMN